jgi:hypothetical protein
LGNGVSHPYLPFHQYIAVLVRIARTKIEGTYLSRAMVKIACVNNTPQSHHSFLVVGLYILALLFFKALEMKQLF